MSESDLTLFLMSHTIESSDNVFLETIFKDRQNRYYYTIWQSVQNWVAYYIENTDKDQLYEEDDYANRNTKDEAINWCVEHWLLTKNYKENKKL